MIVVAIGLSCLALMALAALFMMIIDYIGDKKND